MSLQTRLLAGLAAIAAILLSTAVIVAVTTRNGLLDQIDARLSVAGGGNRDARFDRERPPGQSGSNGPGPDSGAPQPPPERLSDLFEGLLQTNGAMITFFEPNLPGQDFGPPDLSRDTPNLAQGNHYFIVDSIEGSVRYRVATHANADGTVFVAALPLADMDATVRRLILVEVLTVMLILSGLAALAWWVIRLGVRPIKAITQAAGEIAAGGDVDVRVPERTGRTESAELSRALNAMLDRIEAATNARADSEARLRRFVADASHELRTPVTTIRGYAELYHSGGLANPDDLSDAMRRTNDEARRMGRLVEDMLTLAKLDQERPLSVRRVDLTRIAADAATDAGAVAPERNVRVLEGEPVEVDGDHDRLRQVVANLVANALSHTPADTPIDIAAYRSGAEAIIEVTDRGPGMSAEVAARVTERFYRADPSRSRDRGGSGLGLSIVDAVVRAHHGRVEIDTELGRGTTIRVCLPAAQ